MRRSAVASALALVVAAAACAGSHPPATLTAQQQRALAASYLAISDPANRQLDRAVDQFNDHQRTSLPAAASDLRNQASIERHWDRQLLRIGFPDALRPVVSALVQANESRADLALQEAKTSSLPELATFASAHSAADARVEAQVRIIRRDLALPPPGES